MNENLFNVDDIKVEMPSKTLSDNIAKISVIGVGGGGCNMINHMINEGTHKIDLIAANTDLQVLRISKAPKKIQLGLKLTKGLGAGMKPEIGRDSAVESYEDIKDSLKGADIVFIAAGLGGGTGTGAAAIIAKAAKEIGALTVSVVTKPFTWEGKKRAGLANLGLEEIKKISDSIIVVPNDRLLEIIDENVGMKDAFKIIDNILYQAVNGMTEVILNPGNSDIFLISSRPRFANPALFLPSHVNGFVTTETVKAPISFAALAIIAAAPVPVPPPSPAAINTISAPFNESLISS